MSKNVAMDLWDLPLVASKLAIDTTLMTSVSLARILLFGAKSLDAGIGKYIELAEEELRHNEKKESIRVE